MKDKNWFGNSFSISDIKIYLQDFIKFSWISTSKLLLLYYNVSYSFYRVLTIIRPNVLDIVSNLLFHAYNEYDGSHSRCYDISLAISCDLVTRLNYIAISYSCKVAINSLDSIKCHSSFLNKAVLFFFNATFENERKTFKLASK